MALIEESVEIKCPAEKVFTYTTDARNWPNWQSIIPEAEQISEGPVDVNTLFKGVCHMLGLSLKWTAEAKEYKPDTKFSKDITSTGMFIKQRNIYESTEEGTKFTIVYDIKVRGVFKLFSPILISTMRKETKKSLSNLKSILEAQI